MRRNVSLVAALVAGMVLVTAACGNSDNQDDGTVKVAAAFSGPVSDGDYNAIGLDALQAQEGDSTAITYSESVPVSGIADVVQQYVVDGYDVIWTHGSQFYDATEAAARENPDTIFVGEFDGIPENQPGNMWVIDRNFHTVFYPIGTLAAHLSHTGKVGYLGGLPLPFTFAEVHAVSQAIEDSGLEIELTPIWSDDFNDTITVRKLTAQLLDDGNDVIITSLNLGAVGAFHAFDKFGPGEGWITVKYTDKSDVDPDHYAATVLYDFTDPLTQILSNIESGTTTGYYKISFGQGARVDVSDAIPQDARVAVQAAVDGIADGSITVVLDQSPVE